VRFIFRGVTYQLKFFHMKKYICSVIVVMGGVMLPLVSHASTLFIANTNTPTSSVDGWVNSGELSIPLASSTSGVVNDLVSGVNPLYVSIDGGSEDGNTLGFQLVQFLADGGHFEAILVDQTQMYCYHDYEGVDGITDQSSTSGQFIASLTLIDSGCSSAVKANNNWSQGVTLDIFATTGTFLHTGEEYSYAFDTSGNTVFCIADYECSPIIVPSLPSSSLQQYKPDATTTVGEGSTTIENTIVFEGVPYLASSSDSLELQVELATSSANFLGVPSATSSPVMSDEIASATIPDLPDGSYYWQARVMDTSSDVASAWEEFGSSSTPAFTVHQVPLILQGSSTPWSGLVYANDDGTKGPADQRCGEFIRSCGCAITSLAMVAQYYGIDTGIDGNPTTPDNINAWLESSSSDGGYTPDGDVNWPIVSPYFNDVSAGVKFAGPPIWKASSTDTADLDSDLNPYLALNEPAILYIDNAGHFLVADDQLATTYDIKDPAYYLTTTLDENVPTSTTTQDYQNHFKSYRIFEGVSSTMALSGPEGINISMSSPADLVITDPDGNQIGFDPTSSTTYNGIEGATYSSEGISDGTLADPSFPYETKFAWIPSPISGTYNIQVIGTGSGGYTLETTSYDASGTVHEEVAAASTTPDQVDSYNLNFTPDEPNDISLAPSTSTGVAFVQSASSTSEYHYAFSPSVSATFPGTVTTGDTVVAAVQYDDTAYPSTDMVSACRDTNNPTSTYKEAASSINATDHQGVDIWYAPSVVGGTTPTVTCTFSHTADYVSIATQEYSDLAPRNALDATSSYQSGSTTSTSFTTGTATTTVNGDLVFGSFVGTHVGSETFTPGPGFTSRVDNGVSAGLMTEDEVQSTESAISATATSSVADDQASVMATFEAAGFSATAPVIASPTASSTTTSTVTLSSTITSIGNATATIEGFNYGTSTSYGLVASTSGSFGTGAYSLNLTGLTASTTYHFQAFATNSAGTGTSPDATFTTSANPETPAFVQEHYAVPTASTSVSVAYTSAQSAGDLNVVAIGWYNTTTTVASVTDTAGNSYTAALGVTTSSKAGSLQIWYAQNIASSSANANTVTVTFNTTSSYPDVRIAEYSGIATSSPLDVTAASSTLWTTSTLSTSGFVTTTNANDLLVGANYVANTTNSAGTGYTQRVKTSPDGDILEDRVVTSTGSYSATANLSAGAWVMQMAGFETQ
jgi:hypothetical protein